MARKNDSAVLQIEQWPLGKLVEYANNPRIHDAAIDKMVATIKEFGFKVPLVVTSGGEVVDGHLRLKAARVLGLKNVPVILADDLSETQIKAFRLAVNESTNWAIWDVSKLEVELAALREVKFDLEPLGLDDIHLPEIDEEIPIPPRANRSKTTIFCSVLNKDVGKARKAIVAALNRANISHNL